MATIYKKKGRKTYYTDIWLGEPDNVGKRPKKTFNTYHEKESDAQRFANALETTQDDLWKENQRRIARGMPTEGQERELERQREATKPENKPIQEAIDLYITDLEFQGKKNNNGKVRHAKDVRWYLETIVKGCGWKTLADISAPSLKTFVHKKRQERERDLAGKRSPENPFPYSRTGWGDSAANAGRDRVHTFCNWLIEQALLKENPIGQRFKKRRNAQKTDKKRAFSNDELTALLELDNARKLIYQTAAWSGLRYEELCGLTKADLTPERERPMWQLRPELTKNQLAGNAPMMRELAALLLPIWQALPHEYSRMFPDLPKDNSTFNQALNRDLKQAKISKWKDGRKVSFHSFRYHFCVMWAKRLPIQKVKTLMRHQQLRMTSDLYGELGVDDVADEVWSLSLDDLK